jgi:hypothetical protein
MICFMGIMNYELPDGFIRNGNGEWRIREWRIAACRLLREPLEGCILDYRFLSESGFSEFKDSQDSAGGNLRVCLMCVAAESCESLNSENPDSDKKRQSRMHPLWKFVIRNS